MLALKLEELFSKKAKENQIIRKGEQAGSTSATLPNLKAVDTRKELAKIAGIGDRSIDKVKRIEAQATQEQKAKLKKKVYQ